MTSALSLHRHVSSDSWTQTQLFQSTIILQYLGHLLGLVTERFQDAKHCMYNNTAGRLHIVEFIVKLSHSQHGGMVHVQHIGPR